MVCKYKEFAKEKTVEIFVDGMVKEKEFDSISKKLEKFIGKHGKIKVIEIIKNYEGVEFPALFKGIQFDIEHIKDFSHCAVVTDEGWIGPFTRIMSPFFNIKIKVFDLKHEKKAREWLKKAK